MRSSAFLCLSSQLFIFIHVHAQKISGGIIDSKTEEAIPYVAVWNNTKSIGTITNIDGLYQIEAGLEDSVILRCLGYQTLKFKAVDLKGKIIEMSEETVNLSNFVVYADEDPKKIIKAYFLKSKFTHDFGVKLITNVKKYNDSLMVDFNVDKELYYLKDDNAMEESYSIAENFVSLEVNKNHDNSDLNEVYWKGTWEYAAYPSFHCDMNGQSCLDKVIIDSVSLEVYDGIICDRIKYRYVDKKTNIEGLIIISRKDANLIFWTYTKNDRKTRVKMDLHYTKQDNDYFPILMLLTIEENLKNKPVSYKYNTETISYLHNEISLLNINPYFQSLIYEE